MNVTAAKRVDVGYAGGGSGSGRRKRDQATVAIGQAVHRPLDPYAGRGGNIGAIARLFELQRHSGLLANIERDIDICPRSRAVGEGLERLGFVCGSLRLARERQKEQAQSGDGDCKEGGVSFHLIREIKGCG